MSSEPTNGKVSFWWKSVGRESPRRPLPGSTHADVCIIGAGYTGLWTAYYLKKAAPKLRIVMLEQRFAGFGASGRNGGWLTNDITGGRGAYLKSHGREAVGRQQTEMDEFLLLLIGADRAEAQQVIERLRQRWADAGAPVGFSTGTASGEQDLIRIADERMYASKRSRGLPSD